MASAFSSAAAMACRPDTKRIWYDRKAINWLSATMAGATGSARAVLLALERRAMLRAELQPPGHDWVDDLVPRELHALLPDRNHQVVPLLFDDAEMTPFTRLPPALKTLAMRRAISIPRLPDKTHDFSVFDRWLRNLAEGMSGSIAVPASKISAPPASESRVPLPAATMFTPAPPRIPPPPPSPPPPAPRPIPVSRNPKPRFPKVGWPLFVVAALVLGLLCAGIFLARETRTAPSRAAVPTPLPSASGVRTVTVRQALALSPETVAGGKQVLVGSFIVRASSGVDAVLRPVEAEFRDDVRISVRYPTERDRPAEGSVLVLTAVQRHVITGVHRGTDGHWNIAARWP